MPRIIPARTVPTAMPAIAPSDREEVVEDSVEVSDGVLVELGNVVAGFKSVDSKLS